MMTVAQKRRVRGQRAKVVRERQLQKRLAGWERRFRDAKLIDHHAGVRNSDGSITYGAASGGYDAAREFRGYDDWWPGVSSADLDTLPDRLDLLARSRDVCRNNPYARSVIRTFQREVIGRGIRPRPARGARLLGWSTKRVRNYSRQVKQIWERAVPTMHARRKLTIYGLQRQAMAALVRDGDVFVHFVDTKDPTRPYRTGVDLIEAHRVQTPHDQSLRGRRIRDGIELDQNDEPIAIWVEIQDELERGTFDEPSRVRSGMSRFQRIPMRDDRTGLPIVEHLVVEERAGQTRDVPWLSGALAQIRVLGDFVDAELHAKRAEGCIGLAIMHDSMPSYAKPYDEMEPGMIAHFAGAGGIEFLDPKRPGASYAPFVRSILESIAFSVGLPYEVCFLAFSGMNYSNARTMLIAAQRELETIQDQIVHRLCWPLFSRLMAEAWVRGEVSANWPELGSALTHVGWQAQIHRWVDPDKEAKADIAMLGANLSSRSRILGRHGEDFEDVVGELAFEREVLEEEGFSTGLLAEQPQDAKDGEDQQADDEQDPDQPEDEQDDEADDGEEDA
ncbi:MAG: phage portal protein [Planctomycetes bacterium]|nr:phage portal protein [Planctomycetota bacterium]